MQWLSGIHDNICLNQLGVGARKIRNKHVLIVGVGALGSASAESFVRAGIAS